MNEQVIFGIVMGLTLAVVFGFLRRSDPIASSMESTVLRFHKLISYIGGVGIAVGLAGIVLAIKLLMDRHGLVIDYLVLIFFIGFVGLQIILMLTGRHYRLEVDALGITSYNFWRQPRIIRWSDVDAVDYLETSSEFMLKDRGGQSIRCNFYIRNFPTLIDIFFRYLPLEKHISAIDFYFKRFPASFAGLTSDLKVLLSLRKNGSNLDQEHKIEFVINFSTSEVAEDVAVEIRKNGFEVKVVETSPNEKLECLATKEMIPTYTEILAVRHYFEALALRYKGQYDGWGTEIVK